MFNLLNQQVLLQFFRAQIWHTAHRFGEFLIDFSLKSGESIVGKIEWQFDNFSLGKKSWVKSTQVLQCVLWI